ELCVQQEALVTAIPGCTNFSLAGGLGRWLTPPTCRRPPPPSLSRARLRVLPWSGTAADAAAPASSSDHPQPTPSPSRAADRDPAAQGRDAARPCNRDQRRGSPRPIRHCPCRLVPTMPSPAP